MAEDSVADHQVAEGGDTDRNKLIPVVEEQGEEQLKSAEDWRPKPVPGGLEEGQEGHAENVGKAVIDNGFVEARTFVAPDDSGGQQGSIHPREGQGARLIHHFSPIGEESDVTKNK